MQDDVGVHVRCVTQPTAHPPHAGTRVLALWSQAAPAAMLFTPAPDQKACELLQRDVANAPVHRPSQTKPWDACTRTLDWTRGKPPPLLHRIHVKPRISLAALQLSVCHLLTLSHAQNGHTTGGNQSQARPTKRLGIYNLVEKSPSAHRRTQCLLAWLAACSCSFLLPFVYRSISPNTTSRVPMMVTTSASMAPRATASSIWR